ncbi:unnamed protein product [Periconia digitata]|uniref:NACHT domain-containing protein n=1 Tax=Periconia digitata TaxID=1303443 RepID=A0A9W4U5B9_9PLEO|nr:unnamed protein product [Periconia digitata]
MRELGNCALQLFSSSAFRAHSELSTALDAFQQILTADQTAQLRSFSSPAPTPDDVVNLTKKIIEANASRKSHLFASRLQGFLSSIQQYCKIIDTCAGPNQIAALVWGGIKLVLLTSLNFVEYFDKLSKTVAQFSNYCPRLSEYEKLFPTSVRLQQALADFYAVVVQFCSKALGVIQEKGIKRYSKSIWKSFKVDFKEVEENISEAKNEVTEELQLASEQEAASFRRLLTAEADESRAFRVTQTTDIQENRAFRSEQKLERQRINARQIQKILAKEERNKIRLLRRIPNYDYAASLRRAQRQRCAGTSSWLPHKAEFRKWINGAGPKHLWCYGIPGCGKTILVASVVDHLRMTFPGQKETVVIYYFFDTLNKKSLELSTFLRCVLHQALHLENLSPVVERRLESLFDSRMDQLEPSTSELEQLFLHSCGQFKRAFIVIDGLDEVSEDEQRNVKSFLKEVQKTNSARILAFTHAAMNMSQVFTYCSRLHVTAKDLKDDVEIFIDSQIDRYSQGELSACSPSVLDIIKRKLIADAEGMFLWVALQFKALLDVCEEDGTPDRIPDLLETLPRKITDLYSLLLERIAERTGDQAERAKKTFQWVIYSKRPLSIRELEEAVSISEGQKSWTRSSFKLDLPKLARLCGNLIEFDEANGTVSLSHHTVEAFLQDYNNGQEAAKFAIEEASTEQYLADVCLTYLSFTDFHQAITRTSDTTNLHSMNHPARIVGTMAPSLVRPFTAFNALRSRRDRKVHQPVDLVNVLRAELNAHQAKKMDPVFQLLEYCKCYWHSHSRYLDSKDEARFITLENFIRGQHLPREWMPWNSTEDERSLPLWNMFIWTVKNEHTAMFRIWQRIAPMQESSYWDYLWRKDGQRLFASACTAANFELLEMMFNARERFKSVIRPSESEIRQALISVCQLGHDEVLGRLLQEKADVNAAAAAYDGKTALQAAAEGGHLVVVERLLQEKADVNAAAAANRGRTALQAAAGGGHLAVVERLL